MKILISLLISMLCLAGSEAFAKELGSRLGVGYKANYVTFDLPSLSTVYYPNNELAVVGSLGLDTQENNSKFALLGGIRRIIFKEEMMNFFMGGNIAMITNEVAGTKDSGFELAALVGGEFFLNGLDSLGFTFETGVGVTNVKKVRFKTLGDSFVSAGIVFYF